MSDMPNVAACSNSMPLGIFHATTSRMAAYSANPPLSGASEALPLTGPKTRSPIRTSRQHLLPTATTLPATSHPKVDPGAGDRSSDFLCKCQRESLYASVNIGRLVPVEWVKCHRMYSHKDVFIFELWQSCILLQAKQTRPNNFNRSLALWENSELVNGHSEFVEMSLLSRRHAHKYFDSTSVATCKFENR